MITKSYLRRISERKLTPRTTTGTLISDGTDQALTVDMVGPREILSMAVQVAHSPRGVSLPSLYGAMQALSRDRTAVLISSRISMKRFDNLTMIH